LKDIEFRSRILEKGENEKGKFVVLEENRFYPDGKGGQIGDRGTIQNANVLFSEEKNEKTILYVDKYPDSEIVECRIDGNRRHTISALHTAQHILSAVLEDRFGIKTEAFHMSETTCTIDVSQANISDEKLQVVEDMANEIVFSNLPVKKYYAEKEEIEKLHLRSKHEVSGKIRIVEIPTVDISMCGGTHVEFTGEIGLIKIVKKEKVKKQYLRLYFAAEKRTLSYLREISSIANSVSTLLTCGVSELYEKTNKMLSEIKSLKKENKNLKIKILKDNVNSLLSCKEKIPFRKFDLDKGDFMTLLAMLSREKTNKLFVIYSEKHKLIGISSGEGADTDLNKTFEEIFNTLNGKGISKKSFAFAELPSANDLSKALNLLKAKLKT